MKDYCHLGLHIVKVASCSKTQTTFTGYLKDQVQKRTNNLSLEVLDFLSDLLYVSPTEKKPNYLKALSNIVNKLPKQVQVTELPAVSKLLPSLQVHFQMVLKLL